MAVLSSPPGPPTGPAKTFYCVFCRDIASLRMGDFAQFQQHMQKVHSVHYEFDILLAVNFIDRREKDEIIEKVKRKVGGTEEQGKAKRMKMDEPKPNSAAIFSKVTIEKIAVKVSNLKTINLSKTKVKMENNWDDITVENVTPQNTIITAPKTLKNGLQIIPVAKENLDTKIQNRLMGIFTPSDVKIEAQPVRLIQSEAKIRSIQDEVKSEGERSKHQILPCGKCGKKFSSGWKLKKHEEKKFSCEKTCQKCNKEFKMPGDLRLHMTKKSNCYDRQDLKCDNCFKWFGSMKGLESHKNRENPCKKMINCDKCNRLMKEKFYEKHLNGNRCSKPVDLKCRNCLKTFSSKGVAKTHYKRKEVKPTICKKRLDCEKCGRRLREDRFKLHILKNCVYTPADLKCQNCLKTLSSRAAFKHHMKNEDRVCKKRVECTKCGRKLKEEKYKKHIMLSCIHVACERCGERFTELKLKKHMEQKRSCNLSSVAIDKYQIKMELKCDICDEPFNNQFILKHHVKKVHAQKDFACTGCERTFGTEKDLIFHVKRKKDCPAYNPTLEYVAQSQTNVAGAAIMDRMINIKEEDSIEVTDLKAEVMKLSEQSLDEAVFCWGCHKEFKSMRYLAAHQLQKRDCPAFNTNVVSV